MMQDDVLFGYRLPLFALAAERAAAISAVEEDADGVTAVEIANVIGGGELALRVGARCGPAAARPIDRGRP